MGREMRLFVTGGSKFDPAVGRDLYALGFTILQAYGLTETSGAATITSPDEAYLDTVGRALPGQEVRILAPAFARDDGERATAGKPAAPIAPAAPAAPVAPAAPIAPAAPVAPVAPVIGEIAVRGPIVMQGYYNRPDATAAVIQDGWFLTGDLGYLDADGRLTITGRKKEIIVLASGKNIYPEEVEAHYRQSPFIKEIAVLGVARAEEPVSERLHAVVVPDMDLMRERRIVNAGDWIRFEMEGRAVDLPPHKRVLGYDVWFEPLPRTTTGKLKRHEIHRRVVEKQVLKGREPETAVSGPDAAWFADRHVDAASAVIRARAHFGRVVPDANLELDLGFDSMERVELLSELEQKFGVRVSEDRLHDILTVRQLVDAIRPGGNTAPAGRTTSEGAAPDQPGGNQLSPDGNWSAILRDLPPDDDPVLSGLLRSRWVLMPLLFVAARLIRVVLARMDVSGLEHLPGNGPFIISPNHQGYLDPLFVCGALPYRLLSNLFFVGASEYFETPVTRWIARLLNVVPVDPDANLIPAMKAGAFGLKHGKVLVLFPEGERSIDGTVRRFKKGAPILARQLGVPIVPVSLRGSFELWPRNRPFKWRLMWPWSGHRVKVRFGEPMRAEDSRSYGEVASDLRTRVVEMWEVAGLS
jgi:long-chain acyl-CoA synthetase